MAAGPPTCRAFPASSRSARPQGEVAAGIHEVLDAFADEMRSIGNGRRSAAAGGYSSGRLSEGRTRPFFGAPVGSGFGVHDDVGDLGQLLAEGLLEFAGELVRVGPAMRSRRRRR